MEKIVSYRKVYFYARSICLLCGHYKGSFNPEEEPNTYYSSAQFPPECRPSLEQTNDSCCDSIKITNSCGQPDCQHMQALALKCLQAA